MKEEEKKVSQIIRKQSFAQHYFGSQEFFDDLQQSLEVRRNKKTTLESLQLIDEHLQQSTQKLVKEAAKEPMDLTSTALTQHQTKSEEKEKNREEVTKQQKVTEVTNKDESQPQTQVQTQTTSTLSSGTSNLPDTATGTGTKSADSFSKDVQTEVKPTSGREKEKEKTEFAGEGRSPMGGEPILRTGASERSDRDSEKTPERSPSVEQPMFHEKDEYEPTDAAGSNRDKGSGTVQKEEARRSQQTV